jgi:hypothetical protein
LTKWPARETLDRRFDDLESAKVKPIYRFLFLILAIKSLHAEALVGAFGQESIARL